MVAEESNHTEEETSPTEEKDCNMLCCSDGTEMMISVEEIFDIIKNGWVDFHTMQSVKCREIFQRNFI